MATKVEICNLALLNIGVKPITAITEASEAARRLTIIYVPSRDEVLRGHDWKFATRIEALTELADQEVLGWDYVYQVPTNCLFMRHVYDESTQAEKDEQDFQEVYLPAPVNAKVIASNLEDAYGEYTYKITDESLFDASFVNAFSHYLAAQLAIPLTGDKALAEQQERKYRLAIGQARSTNRAEGKETIERTSSYEDAR